jgi:hypothetical protein
MNHSPLQKWADKEPYRWYGVAFIFCLMVLFFHAFGLATDWLAEQQAVEDVRVQAIQQAERDLAKRQQLQDLCGGPEATVVDLAHGGYACLDKDGRRTKVIHGGKS